MFISKTSCLHSDAFHELAGATAAAALQEDLILPRLCYITTLLTSKAASIGVPTFQTLAADVPALNSRSGVSHCDPYNLCE